MQVNDLLAKVVQDGASDLHLSCGLPPYVRIAGEIQRLEYFEALDDMQMQALIDELLPEDLNRKLQAEGTVDLAFQIPDIGRFRLNVFRQMNGMAMVCRVIAGEVQSLADLNAPQILAELAMREQGLVLITGPTGSGKSTTLAAMLDVINRKRRAHILTIEDPIEFIHIPDQCLINQRELGIDTKGFETALSSALREDPDVIMVGEMRNLATIRLALMAAETGHLVLSTLHTNSAIDSVDRIIDVFPGDERSLIRTSLSEGLAAVVSQRLLPSMQPGKRISAWEIMLGIPAVRNLIREGKTAQLYSILETGQQYGMQTMDQCLTDMQKRGLITAEVADRYAANLKSVSGS